MTEDTPTCGTCRWADGYMPILCRRLPPTAFRTQHLGVPGVGYFGRWPEVRADDWCGEHQPRPQPEASHESS